MEKKSVVGVIVMLAFTVGCEGFGPPPGMMMATDDATTVDTGMVVADDAAVPVTDDADTDAGMVAVETDAGTVPATDDAGMMVATDDAAVPPTACAADTVQICVRECGVVGYRPCDTTTGRYEGDCLPFAGVDCPVAGMDAGMASADPDAGMPMSSPDAATPPVMADASVPPTADAGTDAGPAPVDAGRDAGSDAGPRLVTIEILFGVDASALPWAVDRLELREEIAVAGATESDYRLLDCDPATRGMVTEGGQSYYRCRVTRPESARLPFVGAIYFTNGTIWGSVSGWGRTDCDNPATPDRIESATAGMRWVVRHLDGRNLLPPIGIPTVEHWRGITSAGYPVCRHVVTFTP